MHLPAGSRLGPYEIVEAIGAGGMGEVYRARDARLNRNVAIKILPPFFAADPERIVRFDREAQVLASLNHPNIAHIYGIEEAPAARADGERSPEWPAPLPLRAIVMELVEGDDLAARIASGPVVIDEALPIARQIAEGLACAHEQGIVHRDLKPANVKIRDDGTVKVLDFGLARLVDPSLSGPSASAALSPTITSPATQLGVILGTAAYMSPEQARGKAVDKRADIWAFGAVLFEMLTGRRAFEGSEVSDTLALILTKEPDWSALPDTTPVSVRRLLRRCLQKDPRRRLADMSNARLEFDEAASPVESAPAASASALHSRRRWLLPAAVAGAVVVAALLGGLAARSVLRPSAAAQPLAVFSIPLADGVEFTNAGRNVVAISPDGQRIVYVANRRLYLREIGRLAVTPIAGSDTTGSVVGPAFSPDGQHIIYYSTGALRRLPIRGGTPTRVASMPSPLGLQWTPDGIFVGQGSAGIARVPDKGGKPETIATVGADESAQGPHLLPGREVILFAIATGVLDTRWDKARIVAHSLRTGQRRVLIEGGSDPRYVRTGHLLYVNAGVVFAVPFDPTTLTVDGTGRPVIDGVSRRTVTGAAHLAVSESGSVAYVPGPAIATTRRRLGLLDRSGHVSPLPAAVAAYETPRVSPDGARVAVGRDADPDSDIWICEVAGSNEIRRLTFGGNNRFPVWSPDGVQVAFQSDREGDAGLFVQNADGSGAATRLTKASPGTYHVANSWSPDGRWLLFSAVGTSTALHALSMSDKRVEVVDTGTVAGLRSAGGVFSPDGRWLAYYGTTESGEFMVFVSPFPATGVKYQITAAIHPAWASNHELLTSPNTPNMLVFRIGTEPHFAFRETGRIRMSGVLGSDPSGVRNFDVIPGGKQLLVVLPVDEVAVDPREIRVMLNWFMQLTSHFE